MRSFGLFAICAFMYILIIIILQVCEAYHETEMHRTQREVPSSPSGNQRPDWLGNLNATTISDYFQVSDKKTKSTIGAVFGALEGNDECAKKSLCLAGNYLQQLPGRDFIFLFLGRYIPSDYSLLYDIFRVSVMYGQNCEAYLCSTNQPNPPILE